MCEYIKACWKNTIMWKVTKIVLKILCKKSIFYVYQNTRWNERMFAPKIIQNVPKNEYIFMPKVYHRNMLSLECSSKLYFIIESTLHIYVHHLHNFPLICHKCSIKWSHSFGCLCYCSMSTSFCANHSKVNGYKTWYGST